MFLYLTTNKSYATPLLGVRRRRKKHRLVVEVESLALSSKKIKSTNFQQKFFRFTYSNNMRRSPSCLQQ